MAVAHLEHRALRDEQAGDIDGLVEQAAAVLPEVHDDGLDAHRLELDEQLLDVGGGAGTGAVLVLAVEGGELDDAEEGAAAGGGDFDGLGRGHLADELDLVALERDGLAAAGRHVDEETHGRALLAADTADGLGEAHADDVFHLAVFVLADRDDLVAGLHLAREVERAAREEVLDDAGAVFVGERGADAHERVAHRDLELFQRLLGEEGRMRVILAGVGIQEDFLDLMLVEVEVGAALLVALLEAGDGFLRLGRGDLRQAGLLGRLARAVFAEQFGKHVEAQTAFPEGVGVFRGGGPLGLLAVEREGARLREVDRTVEQREVLRRAFRDALLEQGVDLEARGQVAALEVEVEGLAVARDELVDLLGREVHLRAVEILAVGAHHRVHVDGAHVLLADVELLEEGGRGARLEQHRLRGGEAAGLGGDQRCQEDRQEGKAESHKSGVGCQRRRALSSSSLRFSPTVSEPNPPAEILSKSVSNSARACPLVRLAEGFASLFVPLEFSSAA